MSDRPFTRRQALKGTSALATTTLASIAGCLGSEEPARTSTSNRTQAITPTRTGHAPTATESSETTPPRLSFPSEPMELDPRQYATFCQRPAVMPVAKREHVTSVRPAIMSEHKDAFGGSYSHLRNKWYPNFLLARIPEASLTVKSNGTTASLLQFDQETFVAHFEYSGALSSFGTYRGFELYGDDDETGTPELFAAKSPVLLRAYRSSHDINRKAIEHLIDLYEGVTTPRFEANENLATIVDHLPQGAITRVHPQVIYSPTLSNAGVESAGQTLMFDTERDGAEGRTVLVFEESVDPEAQTRDVLSELFKLLNLPLNDPFVQQVGPRTTVVTDTVDPAKCF